MRIGWRTTERVAECFAPFCDRMIDALRAEGHEVLRHGGHGEPDDGGAGDAPPMTLHPVDGETAAGEIVEMLKTCPGVILLLPRQETDAVEAKASGRPDRTGLTVAAALALGVISFDANGADLVAQACAGPILRLEPTQEADETRAQAGRVASFAQRLIDLRPLVETAMQLGEEMGQGGVLRGDPVTRRVARAARALFPVSLAE